MSEPNSNGNEELFLLTDSLPSHEVVIPITSNDGQKMRKFVFGPLDAGTLRGYRQRLSGIGRRKGDTIAANAYVFERLFIRVDGFEPAEAERLAASGKTAKQVFTSDTRYAVLIDNVTTRYMNQVYNLGEVTEDIKE